MESVYTGITNQQTLITLDNADIMLPDYDSGRNPSIILSNGTSVELTDDCLLKLATWHRERIYRNDLANFIKDVDNGIESLPDGTTAELLQDNFDEIMEYYVPLRENDDW